MSSQLPIPDRERDSTKPSLSSHSLSPGSRVSLLVLVFDAIKWAIGLRHVLTGHLSRLSQLWAMGPLEDGFQVRP